MKAVVALLLALLAIQGVLSVPVPKKVTKCFEVEVGEEPIMPLPNRRPMQRAGQPGQPRYRRPCGARKGHQIPIADNCYPNPEYLVKDDNMPETEDIHVVLIDDPMVIIVPNCGKEKTTTCGPPLRRG